MHKPSIGVKPCAIYALSKRDTPASFEEVCGEHHDAEADTRAVAVILFDEEQFGEKIVSRHIQEQEALFSTTQ